MKNYRFLLLFLACYSQAQTQVSRNFLYQGQEIAVLAQNNRMENIFSFPGLRMFIIIGGATQSLDSIYAKDQLRQMPITGMNDYACFYYLRYNAFLKDSSVSDFLQSLIAWCYDKDFTDRNSVHLVWQNSTDSIPCTAFREINSFVSSIHLAASDPIKGCDTVLNNVDPPGLIWQQAHVMKTSVSYHIPGLLEMEEKESEQNKKMTVDGYRQKTGNILLQLTVGNHFIGGRYQTDFDTATLVDFTRYTTIWNINADYYFSRKLSAGLDLAFIYSGKQQRIDGIDWGTGNSISVRGSGYAAAMLRYGIGMGWLVYSRKRLDLLVRVDAGRLKAIAGGGNATRTIGGGGGNTAIVKRTETNSYYTGRTGILYMVSRAFFLAGNLQYTISGFREAMGSVTAFTGWSFNAGIGFRIFTKNQRTTYGTSQ